MSGLTKPVADGNARISATRFGPEAGAMANRIQFYYGPMGGGMSQPLSVASTTSDTSAADPASYLSFVSRAGTTGLTSPSSATALVATLGTGQGVPVSAALGGKVRLFFEARGSDGKTRVMWVDSHDGYVGHDFNAGSSGVCSTAADYQPGGGCTPTVAIAVEGDADGNTGIGNARQFKLAWPTQDDWRWDGAAGRFMVFTTDQVTGCSTFGMNHGYAVWNGSRFVVQYASDGCPKLFTSAQAMLPMHVGDVRYKAYYGDPSVSTGRISSSNLPFLGPKKLIYADGRVSGAADVVDFEDWEAHSAARNVVFLWPNGDQLDDRAEGYIDDYHFLAPTGSLDLQVMYMAITDGSVAPFAAVAILQNP
ncbi:MAG: hypothetical protein AB1635_11510 [Acidobacteriota bacterium]